jgi:hypothetical protein
VLAALCDALGVGPSELVEPVRSERKAAPAKVATTARGAVQGIRPRRARVAPQG